VVVDCGSSIFTAGMAYTALSRVRKLDDLVLLQYDFRKLHMKNPWKNNNWATNIISLPLIPLPQNEPEEDTDELQKDNAEKDSHFGKLEETSEM